MKKVAVIGSTGSIGTQTLDVIKRYPDLLSVYSLVAYSNAEKLSEQTREFSPVYSALIAEAGKECILTAVKNCDIAVIATRGIIALDAVLFCLDNGIDVALANKETLVCAGKLVMPKARKGKLIPVDSEHCAIAECLAAHSRKTVSKILLTASGGPFYGADKESLRNVTAAEALKHPNWSMGEKITVDSATMMNKALEVIEARWLFDISSSDIDIVVHRQSVVHSMVEFRDGSVIAQLASPNMRLPIQKALLGEDGEKMIETLNFEDKVCLTFEKCDFDRFPCAKLGYEIFKYPDLCAAVMNAANDVCVKNFLQGKLLFTDFYNIILKTVDHFSDSAENAELTVENIEKFSSCGEAYAQKLIDGVTC